MITKKRSKRDFFRAVFGGFLVMIGMLTGVFGTVLTPESVYADPETSETEQIDEEDNNKNEKTNENGDGESGGTGLGGISEDTCKASLGEIGWLVCPTTGKIAEAVDWLYDKIEGILKIDPVSTEDGSPIYEIWKYFLGFTNIVFIIFILVVIYSQLTGVGISNYGIKKALPKLIVTAILVNLSFLICSLAVDVSNIIGNGLRDIFTAIEESVMAGSAGGLTGEAAVEARISYAKVYSSVAGGAVLTAVGGVVAFETGAIWMLIPVLLGAIVAVVSGLITIALRQAVVALLIMISPLAIVAYILPNTEKWFKKWKELLIKMLVFYPMFSLLFGASSLAGFAIMSSAKDGFGVLLGMAVQIFPLFFSWSLMKMSGTFLGVVNAKMHALAARPLAANRTWAESRRMNTRANMLAHGVTPSARLMQYLDKRRTLREEDTKNALEIAHSKAVEYTQRKIAGSEIGDTTSKKRRASRYTRNAKAARNYSLIAGNTTAHAEHVLNNYGSYFNKDEHDKALNEQSQVAYIDYWRATYQKDMDDENDINFMVDKYLAANKRDENNRPVDEEAFNRYVSSITGPDGEQRLTAKIIAQASKVESKQRAEYHILQNKFGHNGYNKGNFRDWITGYSVNDDGWAIDRDGKRLRNADGSYVETVQGDALTKAPEKLVLYDKRDDQGLYYDMKDQDGNVVARIHRGIGTDGQNHDDAAFIKETLSNYDIPIADPINNVYSILAGVRPGTITTPQGPNEIGLSRYSTTIGGAMQAYKGNAAWAGAMFNSGIGNRQIGNSAQHAIWVLDSIKKTLKPGAFNTQNPASVEYVTAILNPDNWEKIFTEEELLNAVNINNELIGGEDWQLDENGNMVGYTPVENPSYEQRMNTLKRKLLYPAMGKILPALDRLRTSNTADNQKPGTADAQFEFLKMVEEKWENNDAINFDPTLVNQDLQSEALAFRRRKHDKDGNLIYATGPDNSPAAARNLLNSLEEIYANSMVADDLRRDIFALLSSRREYSRALQRFEELCNENPDATMREIYNWFIDLDGLI